MGMWENLGTYKCLCSLEKGIQSHGARVTEVYKMTSMGTTK